MKYLIILSLVGISLFMGNYQICMYVYPPDKYPDYIEWWGLKQNIYNIGLMIDKTIVFLIIGIYLDLNKFVFLATLTFFAWLIYLSNTIDRTIFNITVFEFDDIVMLIFALIFSLIFYLTHKTGGSATK